MTHPRCRDIDTSVGTPSKKDEPAKNIAETHKKFTGDEGSVDLIEKSIESMFWEEPENI